MSKKKPSEEKKREYRIIGWTLLVSSLGLLIPSVASIIKALRGN